jgi:hypothetical protein
MLMECGETFVQLRSEILNSRYGSNTGKAQVKHRDTFNCGASGEKKQVTEPDDVIRRLRGKR